MPLTDFRTLGRSGLVVSPLALGTMTFGTGEWGADEDTSRAIFDASVIASMRTASLAASLSFQGRVCRNDPQRGGITVERKDGKHEALDISRLADRHIRPGWVRTIHSVHGTTADRVMAHLEGFHANTADAPAVYVAISRAKDTVSLYTDNRAKLTEALGLRDGTQIAPIDEVRREMEIAAR